MLAPDDRGCNLSTAGNEAVPPGAAVEEAGAAAEEAATAKREVDTKMVYQLHQHLYQGLDEFLIAERTVDYSFNCMIERIAAHYDCDPNSIIEEIHECCTCGLLLL